MIIRKYETSDEKNWEDLVKKCKNPAFVLTRRFLQYHENKFDDYSLVVYNDNFLIAALPACRQENVWYAHPGLPFADLIMADRYKWTMTKDIVSKIISFLKEAGFTEMIVKIMPQMYKKLPGDEWLYYLRNYGARLFEQKLTTAIPLIEYENIRKDVINISKQNKRNFIIKEAGDQLTDLYELMKKNMAEKYNSLPTHTLADLLKLQKLFPEKINCIAGFEGEELKGGIILFIYESVVKVQYIFSSQQFLADVLLLKTVELYRSGYTFIDLGTSNSLPNNEINYGVLQFKAKNGGKAFIVESYELLF
ncbi:MAG: hypothetical protein IPN49_03180 [Saprospiraceae bacterium]|nr:hypothetical protein [Saprospiraceae bacterium]MBK8818129.1 hypothetical protein [Saprospiraceae bacterium]